MVHSQIQASKPLIFVIFFLTRHLLFNTCISIPLLQRLPQETKKTKTSQREGS